MEGRTLLSGLVGLARSSMSPALIDRLQSNAISTDPAGVAAVLNALRSGAGSEFTSLIRRQAGNLRSIVNGFTRGTRAEFITAGVAFKVPSWQEAYTGPHQDQLAATGAGAIALKDGRIELAGIMRGPYDEPVDSYVVFGIDRGAGSQVGARFASRPRITPDLLVSIRVGPYGSSNSGTITDLTTNTSRDIEPGQIQVQGAVVRVFVDADQVPSTGFAVRRYKVSMWTQDRADGGLESVGSFVPESSMFTIGVQQVGRRR
jgi:hypothetical protein